MDYGASPESADFVLEWLASHNPFKLFINGTWAASAKNAQRFTTSNPATGKHLADITAADAEDVDSAVKAARRALPAWRALSDHQRARYLYAIARLIQKNSRFLAVLDTLDNGKPIRETRDIDIPLAARHFYHHAGWAQLLSQEFPGFEPVGVVAQIIPWNFPFLMLAWKIAPALATGNTVVLKPAEYTSLSALYFGYLCQEAGVPPGVVNIVTGGGPTGALLAGHSDIDKIAFTGSTEVGRSIRRQTAGTDKKLSLELGGKSPFIVFADADLDAAVEGLVDAIWYNQGEVCCAGSRLLMEESIAAELIARVKQRLQHLRVGDPLDKSTDMGAITDPAQLAKITAIVERGAAEGASVWHPDIEMPSTGCFYPPTLITDVAPSSSVMQQEIFGPVLAALSFRTLKEAVALANNTPYGLAASVWTENISRALEAATALKAGVVWINSTNQFDAACPFGGYRESGFGREGGKAGIYEYLKPDGAVARGPATLADWEGEPSFVERDTDDIDQTAKNYIGGRQKRPDSGRTVRVTAPAGAVVGRVSLGSRKDIRDAVEAAQKAEGWETSGGHARAQILYFVAENLHKRAAEFERRLKSTAGATEDSARQEVQAATSRLFSYAAWADKYDGQTLLPPGRHVTLSLNEPIGVVGIVCPDVTPFLSFVSLCAPAVALGNRVIIVPSQRFPLPATDFYEILETSDVPDGVINIVTGRRAELAKVLAEHDQVDAVWCFGSKEDSKAVEMASAGNLKRCWTNNGQHRDWLEPKNGEGQEFLRQACQVKTLWLPYGD
jgi:aldehyde dehydrogenase (NAD+)